MLLHEGVIKLVRDRPAFVAAAASAILRFPDEQQLPPVAGASHADRAPASR